MFEGIKDKLAHPADVEHQDRRYHIERVQEDRRQGERRDMVSRKNFYDKWLQFRDKYF